MLADEEVAPVNHDAVNEGRPFQATTFTVPREGRTFNFYELPGFDEQGSGLTPEDIVDAYRLVRNIQDGVHLLLFCIRRRITSGLSRNWTLYHDIFCQKAVSTVAVINGFESGEDLNQWWSVNERAFKKAGCTFSDQILGTTMRAGTLDSVYVSTREKVHEIVPALCMRSEPWIVKDRVKWLNAVAYRTVKLRFLWWTIGKRRVAVEEVYGDLERLRTECGMSKTQVKEIERLLQKHGILT
ncbi:hypothetical protein CC1G_03097 [Coprinopsis cinerea okayama7|uniref:G domain-containing protein n=1 Tax=Coprinopsis cinerea (strain Okayama-7 / 130 / ATCC MYA-4618 / FGSC 9003) TaxID=240176 RepID=A8PEX5_COPC7|nr:hypothetical protein CC1G_03097 [Coprinopsis cinerea okayama7\|eukprot:XP_001840868.2 hypothetical protein CC1G_03097 [Coprinopsis cinerea okayama7\